MTERLPDTDTDWGCSRAEYAQREAARRRQLARTRLQKALAAMRERRASDPDSTVFVPIGRISVSRNDDWHLRIQRRQDTRNATARMLGDPAPGRSALDLRNGAQKP